MKLKLFTAFLIIDFMCLGMNTLAHAQTDLLRAIDYAQFRYNSTSTTLEVYTSISPSRLTFHKVRVIGSPDSNQLVSTVKLEFLLKNLRNDSSYQVFNELPLRMPDTSAISQSARLVTVTRILADTGKYRLQVNALAGKADTTIDSLERNVVIRDFPDSELTVSSIELCSDISPGASKNDPYYKNTLHVVPNPELTYGTGMPVASYYAEIYGLGLRNDSTEYNVSWHIVDTYGRTLMDTSALKAGLSSDVVEIGSDDISSMPTGRYALELFVTDSVTRQSAYASKYFFVYNPYVKQPVISSNENVNVLSSPFYEMGEKELNNLFYAANYLEAPQQTDEYRKLKTVDAKRRFLAEFWVAQNRAAGAGGFNSWRSFDERYKYVNHRYNTAYQQGWLTDR